MKYQTKQMARRLETTVKTDTNTSDKHIWTVTMFCEITLMGFHCLMIFIQDAFGAEQ